VLQPQSEVTSLPKEEYVSPNPAALGAITQIMHVMQMKVQNLC